MRVWYVCDREIEVERDLSAESKINRRKTSRDARRDERGTPPLPVIVTINCHICQILLDNSSVDLSFLIPNLF